MKTFYEIMEEKDLNNLTPLEYAIWFLESATGASGAQQAAQDLARITAERDTAMKLLARADVAFRCDLTQPEANDYYWRTREDIAAILKKSA